MSGLPHLAQLDDVHEFGRQTVARSMLPVLIRRIIKQSNDSVTVLQMAGEEDTDLGGYDGIVAAGRGDAFVPAGRSVWEFGASGEPGDKAQRDYRKRTTNPLGEDPATSTFVFVTPHRWPEAEDWARRKRAEGVWRDVRVYTANDILTALEGVPAVHLWFSEFRGKPATGAASLESWWGKFQKPTKGLLTPELVLSGREDASAQLLRTLTDQDSSHLWVRAATIDDVLAFVAATLVANGRTNEDDLLARAVVVYEPGVLRYLDHTTNLLILVPFTESLIREADLVTEHHVILMTTDAGSAVIDLPPIAIEAATAVLKAQSVPEATALEYARAAFRSVPLFRSTVQGVKLESGQLVRETVATSRIVRRAWFLGRWNGRRPGDSTVVASLTEASPADLTTAVDKYAGGANPVFSRVGDTWAVISPADSAGRISPSITADDLAAFETVVQNVIGAVDPALSLPAKDRWTASLYGKSREHSSDLRTGIATSLALLGSLDQPVADQTASTLRGWCAQIVRAVLGRANEDATGDLWLALIDLLPKLAEGAPEEVLSALRTALAPSGSLRPRIFADSSDWFASTSPHVYVLWALERLAWSTDYLGAAVQVLALLASLDPGGKLSNRPLSSLTSILRAWRPRTAASREARNAAARRVGRRFPVVGGELAVSLIPGPSEFTGETAAPEFRDWKTEPRVTTAELFEDITFYAGLAADLAATDPTIWLQLVPKLPDLPVPTRDDILGRLATGAIEPEETRTRVWAALTDLIRRHDEFSDSEWALPPAQLDRLRAVAATLAPADVVAAVEWLFDYTPFVGVPLTDTERHDAAVGEAQERAVRDVFSAGGLDAVVRLARAVKTPWALGSVFAGADLGVPALTIAALLDDDDVAVRNFAFSAIARVGRHALEDLEPLARELDRSAAAKARVLLAAEDLERTWAALTSFGRAVEDAYWAEFSAFGRGGDFSLFNESARGLADHGRIAAALDLLAIYSHRAEDKVDPHLIADLLGRLLGAEDPELHALSEYDFDQLLNVIRSAPQVSDDTVATLEWSFLPALAQHEESLTLQRRLAEQPAFFADVITMAFRARHHDEGEEEATSPQVSEGQATNAWRLLHAWKVVPGTDRESGVVDAELLEPWVTEARRLLEERDRADVGDSQIGQVLAHAPTGEDGTWPCEPVRDLIEDLGAEHVNSGFVVGIHNKRGMVSRGLDEGGAQEFALEQRYTEWAQALAVEWPQVAGLLRSVAAGYHAEGVRNDEAAQRFREGLDE